MGKEIEIDVDREGGRKGRLFVLVFIFRRARFACISWHGAKPHWEHFVSSAGVSGFLLRLLCRPSSFLFRGQKPRGSSTTQYPQMTVYAPELPPFSFSLVSTDTKCLHHLLRSVDTGPQLV